MNKRTSRPWKGALMQAGEKFTYDEMGKITYDDIAIARPRRTADSPNKVRAVSYLSRGEREAFLRWRTALRHFTDCRINNPYLNGRHRKSQSFKSRHPKSQDRRSHGIKTLYISSNNRPEIQASRNRESRS